MNFIVRASTSCLLVTAFIFSTTELVAQSIPQPVRGQPIQLFDGKSLQGWSKQNGNPSKNWVVQDGTVYRASKGGDLYHEQWFRDFELTFQWKINAKGNSGVKYRVQQYGKRFLGCEFQLMDDEQEPFGKQSTGSLYALYAPNKNRVTNPPGEWNSAKIVVCGNHVEHWINGAKVIDATFGNADWFSRVANSKFSKHEQFGLNREGRIFLQDHGKPTWFREIIVTPMDCDGTAACQIGN